MVSTNKLANAHMLTSLSRSVFRTSSSVTTEHIPCGMPRSKGFGDKTRNGTEHKLDSESDWSTNCRSRSEGTELRWKALSWRPAVHWLIVGFGGCPDTQPVEITDT